MTDTPNRLFDEFSRLMTDAAGMAQGAKREMEALFHSRMDKFLTDLDVVRREEFDVVKDIATKALSQIQALEARVQMLEKNVS